MEKSSISQEPVPQAGELRRPNLDWRRRYGFTILFAISPLETDRVIEEKASDLKTYGLAEPAVEVSARTRAANRKNFWWATMSDGRFHLRDAGRRFACVLNLQLGENEF